ncbi:MAG: nucleotidyltransferase family protein [Bacteroidales bacterium]|nr:nucleotidyltransferase family protein [Bacteroidales bacterium]
MKAMIFAAGLGTRLKPLTDTMPKALVPVAGKPLLAHVLEKLVGAGYDDITVNVHHFPDQIIKYLADNDFGAHISISDERDLLRETGGGIKFARPLLEGSEPFLVHNVDILSDLDLEWFRSQHRPDALATLLVSERKTQRYLLFDSDGCLAGWTNIATGEVRSPRGSIDPANYRMLAFSGIHCISQGIFDAFTRYGFGNRFSIMDFYLTACADYPIRAAVPTALRLLDVGKLDTLTEAESFLRP